VPIYQSMVEDAEQERNRRIKAMAEQSLQQSRLPPNMEAQEKKRKQQEKLKPRASSVDQCTFKPPTPKAVPDFKRLQKDFAKQMERNKSAQKLTVV
jgi:hypothetical protein